MLDFAGRGQGGGLVLQGRLPLPDFPLPVEALRKALVNAFVRRDYADCDGSVAVALFDDRLEIISAGELHFGLTPEMLFQLHESRPWNPLIASVFYRRGHIETWGRGTLKIVRLMQEAGLQPPVMRVNAGFVTLTFTLPSNLLSHTMGESREEAPGKTPDLILGRLAEAPSASIPELAQALGKSESAIERAIRKLRADGKLARVGPAKGGHWQVLPPGAGGS